MSAWELLIRTKSRVTEPCDVVKVACPRPSAVTEYLPPVIVRPGNGDGRLASFRSSAPPVIPPVPLATKSPPSANGAPPASTPSAENAYVPLRSLLLKLPLGGGVALLLPPPQPASTARAEKTMGRTKRLRNDMTSP